MNLETVVLFGIGAILLYAAIKDKDPRDVVKDALRSQGPVVKAAPNPRWPGGIGPDVRQTVSV